MKQAKLKYDEFFPIERRNAYIIRELIIQDPNNLIRYCFNDFVSWSIAFCDIMQMIVEGKLQTSDQIKIHVSMMLSKSLAFMPNKKIIINAVINEFMGYYEPDLILAILQVETDYNNLLKAIHIACEKFPWYVEVYKNNFIDVVKKIIHSDSYNEKDIMDIIKATGSMEVMGEIFAEAACLPNMFFH